MYQVNLKEKAKGQFKEIISYIALDNPPRAKKYAISSFEAFKNKVAIFPKSCAEEIEGIYKYVYKKNLLFFYNIDENSRAIIVFKISHSKDYNSYKEL